MMAKMLNEAWHQFETQIEKELAMREQSRGRGHDLGEEEI